MDATRTRNNALAVIGLSALGVYILACRPSFSPDGSKILLPSLDPDTKSCRVHLYDRQTGKIETVFTISSRKDPAFASAQWASDGKKAVITSATDDDDNPVKVAVLSLETKAPVRLFDLPPQKDSQMGLLFPPPVIGHYLFFGGEKELVRLNLETGEVKTSEATKGIVLARFADQVYYFTENDGEGNYEIAKVDKEALARVHVLQISKRDAGEPLHNFFTVTKDESRIAIVTVKDEQLKILVFRGKELEKTIPVGSEAEPVFPGNLEWSPDGKTIYAAYSKDLKEKAAVQMGVLEVPLNGDTIRQIPLLDLTGKDADELDEGGGLLMFQIALSADGKTIAASSAMLKLEKKTDRALFLVDIASPERKVTKIPLPSPPVTGTTEKKE